MRIQHLFLLFGALAACKDAPVEKEEGQANNAPVANAGSNVEQSADLPVTLNGRGSYDPDGDVLSYQWIMDTVPAGSSLVAGSALSTDAVTTFSPDRSGTYVASLSVTDPAGAVGWDSVIITVGEGALPVADAGPDTTGTEGTTQNLDGSRSFDPTGRTLGYRWELQSVPTGSSLTGVDTPTGATTTFVPDMGGIYIASLVVNNGISDSAPDTAVIRVRSSSPTPPTADAGEDVNGMDCTTLNLVGTNSFDPNGDPLAYEWRLQEKPVDSNADNSNIGDRYAASTTFFPDAAGTYILSLAVFDGTSWSAPDTVSIIATERDFNTVPVVDAGLPQSAEGGNADCRLSGYSYICSSCESVGFNLGDDATVSDPDGDPITLRWELVAGSGTIADPESLRTTVRLEDASPTAPEACEPNAYELQLRATDCTGESSSDLVTYTVSCCGVLAATP
jgi:hypothetical protein